MGNKSSGDVAIGYYYHLSMHMVLCVGPVDSVNRIKAGDYLVWGPELGTTEISDERTWLWVPEAGSNYSGPANYTAAIPYTKIAGKPDVYLTPSSEAIKGIGNTVVLSPSDQAWLASYLAGDPTINYKVEGSNALNDLIATIPPNHNWNKLGTFGADGALVAVYPATVGRVKTNGFIVIDRPNLFGGKKREGGFSGTVQVLLGASNQQSPAFLQNAITPAVDAIPAYRGVTSLIWQDCYYSANAARPKPWSVECTRIPLKSQFSSIATVQNDISYGEHANPALIILECLTNEEWGLGYTFNTNPALSDIDEPSFTLAAEILHEEEFGLSMLWANQTTVEDFISTVALHIDATVFADPATGKFKVKLVRNNYVYDDLVVFDENNIVEIRDYARTGTSELINQITVKWVDGISNKWMSLTKTNAAVREMQGAVVAITKEYPGVATRALAEKLALRDISVLSQPLASVTLITNRAGASLLPGDVIKWDWKDLGIEGMPLRVVNVGYGTLLDGKVTVECVEDVFGAERVTFHDINDTSGPDASNGATGLYPSTHVSSMNASYVDTMRGMNAVGMSIKDVAYYLGFYIPLASRPTIRTTKYRLSSGINGTNVEYRSVKDNYYIPYAETTTALAPSVAPAIIYLNNAIALEDVSKANNQGYILVGKELMELADIAKTDQGWRIICYRGVIDTPPMWHAAGTAVWFYSATSGADTTPYSISSDNDDVAFKLQTYSGSGDLMKLEDAPKHVVRIDNRWYRPYPPGNVKISGTSESSGAVSGVRYGLLPSGYIGLIGDLVVTWSGRNRILQSDYLTRQDAENVAKEKGTTYTVRVLKSTGELVRMVEHLVDDTWTYSNTDVFADIFNHGLDQNFYIALYSVRHEVDEYDEDVAYASTYPQLIPVARTASGYSTLTGVVDDYEPTPIHPINAVQITNLRLKNGKIESSIGKFSGKDAIIQWDTNVDDILADKSKADIDKNKLVDKYEVRIYEFAPDHQENYTDQEVNHALGMEAVSNDHLPGGMTIHKPSKSFFVTDQEFFYSFVLNEKMGLHRKFVVRVRAHTANGRYSTPAVFIVENPMPVFTGVSATAYTNGLVEIRLTKPTDPDYVRYMMYQSLSDTITGDENPFISTDLVIHQVNTTQPMFYFRLRPLDEFSLASVSGIAASELSQTYRVKRKASLEEFSQSIWDSEAYKYLIAPIGDFFNLDQLKKLTSDEITRLNDLAEKVGNMETSLYEGSEVIKELDLHAASTYQVLQAYLGDTNARVIQEENTRATQTEAIANAVRLIDSHTKNSSAYILQWYTTIANDVSSLARSIKVLEAKFKGAINEVSAAIHRVDLARADERNAFAGSLVDYQAQIGGPEGVLARVQQIASAQIGYCKVNGEIDINGYDPASCALLGGTWYGELPLTQALTKMQIKAETNAGEDVDAKFESLMQQVVNPMKGNIHTLSKLWSIKSDDTITFPNGDKKQVISGIAYSSVLTPNGPDTSVDSTILIAADKFAIIPPYVSGNNYDINKYTVPFGYDADSDQVYIKNASIKELEVHKLVGDISKFNSATNNSTQVNTTSNWVQAGSCPLAPATHEEGHIVTVIVSATLNGVGYTAQQIRITLSFSGLGVTLPSINKISVFDTSIGHNVTMMMTTPIKIPRTASTLCTVEFMKAGTSPGAQMAGLDILLIGGR